MNDSLVATSDCISSRIDADPTAAARGGGVIAPGRLSCGDGCGVGCCAFESELFVEELEQKKETSDAAEVLEPFFSYY